MWTLPQTNKTVPIKGKHQKRISCGAWNRNNKLALGAEDKQITGVVPLLNYPRCGGQPHSTLCICVAVSNSEGDNLETLSVKTAPTQLAFNEQKTDDGYGNEQRTETVTVNLANKNVYMCSMHDLENPVELAFEKKYGDITKYKWFGDGYVMLGFTGGYLNAVSTHMKEIGACWCLLHLDSTPCEPKVLHRAYGQAKKFSTRSSLPAP